MKVFRNKTNGPLSINVAPKNSPKSALTRVEKDGTFTVYDNNDSPFIEQALSNNWIEYVPEESKPDQLDNIVQGLINAIQERNLILTTPEALAELVEKHASQRVKTFVPVSKPQEEDAEPVSTEEADEPTAEPTKRGRRKQQ